MREEGEGKGRRDKCSDIVHTHLKTGHDLHTPYILSHTCTHTHTHIHIHIHAVVEVEEWKLRHLSDRV